MTLLTAEQILEANQLKTVDVEIEEWGGTIRLRDINARQKLALLPLFQDEDVPRATRMIAVLAECIVDEENKPIFNNDDKEALQERFKNPVILTKLFSQASTLIGFDKVSTDKVKKN